MLIEFEAFSERIPFVGVGNAKVFYRTKKLSLVEHMKNHTAYHFFHSTSCVENSMIKNKGRYIPCHDVSRNT